MMGHRIAFWDGNEYPGRCLGLFGMGTNTQGVVFWEGGYEYPGRCLDLFGVGNKYPGRCLSLFGMGTNTQGVV